MLQCYFHRMDRRNGTRALCEVWLREMHDSINSLAYQLWERSGRPDGRSMEFWLEAEDIHRFWYYQYYM